MIGLKSVSQGQAAVLTVSPMSLELRVALPQGPASLIAEFEIDTRSRVSIGHIFKPPTEIQWSAIDRYTLSVDLGLRDDRGRMLGEYAASGTMWTDRDDYEVTAHSLPAVALDLNPGMYSLFAMVTLDVTPKKGAAASDKSLSTAATIQLGISSSSTLEDPSSASYSTGQQ